jgi:Na+/H+ antiporter NhaC
MPLKKLSEEVKTFNPRRSLLAVVIVVLASYLFTFLIPESYTPETGFGIFSLIPAGFLIIYIFITKRILEALTLASVLGFMMVVPKLSFGGPDPVEVFNGFSGGLIETVMSEDIAWLFIVCGLMGAIISLIEKSGGASAFGDWVSRRAKTRKSTLIWTWLLGVVIFIDDYLNSLTVGSSMAPATDKQKVPREFLAYIVDSTAAPVCVLIPITTWSVFCGQLLETNGWAPEGLGTAYFMQTIPFSFYSWAATLIVPLVILGVIPIFGPMKKAELRVQNGGPLAPPDSDKIDIKGGVQLEIPANPKVYNFAFPIIVLVGMVIATKFIPAFDDYDMQIGVIVTMIFIFIFYLVQKVMTADEFWDMTLMGLKNMLMPLLMMVLTFLFASVNDQIGFTKFVIDSAAQNMSPAMAPLIIFGVLAVTEFITGTNWGMYIIALPIVIPLAQQMGVSLPLAVAAVISAGVLGSHVCFYSDATILTSAATGCNNFRHAITQMPFGFLAAGIAAVLYLIFGFVMAPGGAAGL